MTRIVTTTYRYKRPPKKQKAVALEARAVEGHKPCGDGADVVGDGDVVDARVCGGERRNPERVADLAFECSAIFKPLIVGRAGYGGLDSERNRHRVVHCDALRLRCDHRRHRCRRRRIARRRVRRRRITRRRITRRRITRRRIARWRIARWRIARRWV